MGYSWHDFKSGASYWSNKVQDSVTDWANILSAGGHDRLDLITKNLTGETAQENIEIERQREDSRYQRLMEDLAAAGLNPSSVLGSSGGAVPSNGVSGSVQSNLGALGGIISAGADAYLSKSRKDKTDAETKNINEDTYGKEIDNSIKAETGLLQAWANLDLTNASKDDKIQSYLLGEQKYQINANEIIKSFNESEKSKYEKEKAAIEKNLLAGEYDERANGMLFSGEWATFSESQLMSGKLGVNLLKSGIDLGGSGSQATEHKIPLGVINAAINDNDENHDRAMWLLKNVYLVENIGTIRKNFDKRK